MHSIVALWLGNVGAERERDCDPSELDAMLVKSCGELRCRLQLGALFPGATTRLSLGALGTTAMARVISDLLVLKRGSFLADVAASDDARCSLPGSGGMRVK
jgi:hypothetical protein